MAVSWLGVFFSPVSRQSQTRRSSQLPKVILEQRGFAVRVQGGCSAGDGRAGRANLHPDAMQPDLSGALSSCFRMPDTQRLMEEAYFNLIRQSNVFHSQSKHASLDLFNTSLGVEGIKITPQHKEIKHRLVPITVTGLKK